MRIPKKVRICGQMFDIKIQDEILVGNGKQKEKLLGLCDTQETKIYLKKGMSNEKKKEVFLHECIHAIEVNLDLGLAEQKVNLLGVELLSFLKDSRLDFNS